MTVTRYLVVELIRGWLLSGVLLVALISLLVLLEELEDVGDAQYRLHHALMIVAAGIPARLVTLLPFIALLGTLYAIADLARRSELEVLQASGMSQLRVALVAVVSATTVATAMVPFDEFVAAPLLRDGLTLRAVLAEADDNVLGRAGFWARSGQRFINVERFSSHTSTAEGVRVFDFDGRGVLRQFADGQAVLAAQGAPVELVFEPAETRRYREGEISFSSAADPRTRSDQERLLEGIPRRALRNAALPMAAMAPSELAAQASSLENLGQRGGRYAGNYWRRLLAPLSVIALTLVAVPFAFGRLRAGGFAARLALGAVAGLGWYIGEQIIFSAGLLAGYSPVLVAMAPAMAVSVVAVLALRRTLT